MMTISRLADYGTLVMAAVAAQPQQAHKAQQLAQHLGLPYATVRKLLKILAAKGLLVSQRGPKGGYGLAFQPQEISLAQVIAALDGPMAVTLCSQESNPCALARQCAMNAPWQVINSRLLAVLESATLAQIVPQPREESP